MQRRWLMTVIPMGVVALVLVSRFATGGDLNPPPGPIAPTQRTPIGASTTPGDNDGTPSLFKITLPGSYDLRGIIIGFGSTVTNCWTGLNTGDGIRVSNDCTARGNNCEQNGDRAGPGAGDGAGIHVTGSDNRLEGNNCTGADRGIDVNGAGNLIIKNSCSGNTNNWDVVAGNVILVVNATTAGAVSGDSGGAAPGSTDPNANFTY